MLCYTTLYCLVLLLLSLLLLCYYYIMVVPPKVKRLFRALLECGRGGLGWSPRPLRPFSVINTDNTDTNINDSTNDNTNHNNNYDTNTNTPEERKRVHAHFAASPFWHRARFVTFPAFRLAILARAPF